jgi:AraC family transcriptional regulator
MRQEVVGMIVALNAAIDAVEGQLTADPSMRVDVGSLARGSGTTEYHLRRMFSSLAGMPLSDYVRRRRMSLAAADLVTGDDDLLEIAVRYGYGSTEAFSRAFRTVHGAGPSDVRNDGGPLRTQPRITFHLDVRGASPMDTRIVELPAVRLVGHATRVPLVHEGVNPAIAEHVASIPIEETVRLKALNDTEPSGVLAVSDDLDPDRTEGSELTYLHGVATTHRPDGLDTIEVPAAPQSSYRARTHRAPSRVVRNRHGMVPSQRGGCDQTRSWRCSRSMRQRYRDLRALAAVEPH